MLQTVYRLTHLGNDASRADAAGRRPGFPFHPMARSRIPRLPQRPFWTRASNTAIEEWPNKPDFVPKTSWPRMSNFDISFGPW